MIMMRCEDLKTKVDWGAEKPFAQIASWLDPTRYVAEAKVDGVGVLLAFGENANAIESATRGLDRTDHFPQFRDAVVPMLAGTVLAGELVAAGAGPAGLLTQSTALMNSLPAKAVATQKVTGLARLYAYDILAMNGEPTLGLPYEARRGLLEALVDGLPDTPGSGWRGMYPDMPAALVERWPASEEAIWTALSMGYEGVVLKRKSSRYSPGARQGSGWGKLKKITTGDFVIIGWRPGENANAGLVGSFALAVQDEDGELVPVGHCGNFTADQRRFISAPDGSLKQEFYDKVVEVTAQGAGPGGQLRHCLFVRFRPDKGPEDTVGQLELFPRV